MIAPFAELLTISQTWFWLFFIVFLRVGAMVSVAPGFGQSYIPMRVKLMVGLVLTVAVLPSAADEIPVQPIAFSGYIRIIVIETVVGLFFGLMLRFFILALQTAGTIAAQSTSLSQIFGGSAGADPAPAMGHVLVAGGLALSAMMGLHVQMASYALQSYMFVPTGILPSAEVLTELGVAEVSRCFRIAFKLAAPFLVASMLYNVTLGVINRAMPQLMVFFIGAPAVTAGGVILLMLSAPLLLALWASLMQDFMHTPFEGAP